MVQGLASGMEYESRYREYDLIVIGTGGAGMAAAIRGAEAGSRVAVVEAGVLGGTCVNIGCVPSKTLIRAAERYYGAAHHGFDGVRTEAVDLDWQAVVRQKGELVEELRQHKYAEILESYGGAITLVKAHARVRPDASVALDDGSVLRANRLVVATGASPRILDLPGIEGVPVLTSTSLMSLERKPESLVVIGGRAVALELGQMLSRFGTRVTLLQRSDLLIPDHEPEVSRAVERYLREEGLDIHTGVAPTSIRQVHGERVVTAVVDGYEREYRGQDVLMATGRTPNTRGLGLADAGVEVDRHGFIVVDETMRTSNPRIYAAGDVTQLPKLVYVAAAGGNLAAANALSGEARALDLSVVPDVIFTDPQAATVGMTERKARAAGHAVRASIVPLEHVPRALAARDTRGLIKLVADAGTNLILGGQIVAHEGGESIQIIAIAMKSGMTIDALTGTLFPYLTLSEGIKLAAQSFTKDVARLSCCAG